MTSPQSLPYIGSKISLISNAGIRYEGVLFNINTTDSTVGLTDVRTFGTEGRKPAAEIPPSDDVYDYIVFRGKDIQDLTVSEPAPPDDPAIVAINPMPTSSGGHGSIPTGEIHYGMNNNTYSHRVGMNGGRIGMDYMPGGRQHMNNNGRSGGMYNTMMNHRDDGYQRRGQGYQSNGYIRRGGYGRGGGRSFGVRRVIGELTAQPNQNLKSQLSKAFDFDEANKKFDKTSTTSESNQTATEAGKENEGVTKHAAAATPIKTVYDKKSSFFDHISCETLDRQAGHDNRVDRTKQRQLDVETFGQSANVPIRRSNRGYRRGGGGNTMGYHRGGGHMILSGGGGGYQPNYPFHSGRF